MLRHRVLLTITTWILYLIQITGIFTIASADFVVDKPDFRFQPRSAACSFPLEFYNSDKHFRSKRSGNCDYRCDLGKCLRYWQVCNGASDCMDGSDETREKCGKQSCSSALYQCKYGACIPSEKVCDGVIDCIDKSDEDIPRCVESKPAHHCVENVEFRCQNGQCIDVEAVCDGIKTCSDGSDETKETCSVVTCPPFLYQCSYGACVSKDARCNGVEECRDGSDEIDCPPSLSTSVESLAISVQSTSESRTEGVLPDQPSNGLYQLPFEDTDGVYVTNGAKMELTCDTDYVMRGIPHFVCSSGIWKPPIDQSYCTRECPTLIPTSTYEVVCTRKGVSINCVTPPEGTVAQIQCISDYTHNDKNNSMLICGNGSWSDEPKPCTKVKNGNGCDLPSPLANGHFVTPGSDVVLKEDAYVPYLSILKIVCDSGYVPTQPTYSTCFGDKWKPDISHSRCLRAWVIPGITILAMAMIVVQALKTDSSFCLPGVISASPNAKPTFIGNASPNLLQNVPATCLRHDIPYLEDTGQTQATETNAVHFIQLGQCMDTDQKHKPPRQMQ